jgi:hypothetical protein
MQQPCPFCGAYVRAGVSFCGTCGKAIPAPTAMPTPAVRPPFAAPALMPSAAYLLAADGRQYPLTGQVTRLGRSSQCTVQILDDSVSGMHAEIESRGAGFFVRDLGSTNGTCVNGIRIAGESPLRLGDQVIFGEVGFTLQGSMLGDPIQPTRAISLAPAAPGLPQSVPQGGSVAVPAGPPWGLPLVRPPSSLPALHDWGTKLPALEGRILHVDGPHKEQKGSAAGTAVAAGCLAIIATPLMFIPFLFNRDVSVYYLRVEDLHSGQHHSAKIRGEPSGMVSQGDVVAFWGRVDGGTLLVNKAYNYNTDAFVKVK